MVDGRRKEEHLFLRSGIIRKGAGEEISTLKNAQVNLSPSEGLMLRALLERNGQFVAYDDLRSALWSDLENGRRKVTNTLDQLRRKMKAAGIQFEVQGGRTELRFEVPEPQSFVFERQASELPKEVLNGPGPWRKDDAKIPMQQALKAAKLERMTFHELRHTYASMLVNSGVPLKVIAEQLGHVDTRMVEEHYGHLCQTAKRDTIRALSPMRLTGQPLQRPKAKMSDLKKAGGV